MEVGVKAELLLKIESVQAEKSSKQYEISISLGRALYSKGVLNTTSIIPLSVYGSKLQLKVSPINSTPLGTIAFNIKELLDLEKGIEKKHWVTLFDGEDDNVYDGDYEENDIDLPRILLSYQIIPSLTENKEEYITKDLDIKASLKSDLEESDSPKVRKQLFIKSDYKSGLETGGIVTESKVSIDPFSRRSSILDEPLNEEEDKSEIIGSVTKEKSGTENQSKSNTVEIEMLNILNEKIKEMKEVINDLQLEKAGILKEYEKQIEIFEAEYNSWLEEKYSLRSKIISLECDLNSSKEENNKRLHEVKDQYEQTKADIISDYKKQIHTLESTIQSLKSNSSIPPSINYDKAFERLNELTKECKKKIDVLSGELEDSLKKQEEMAKLLKEKEDKIRMLSDTINKLENENKLMKKELNLTKEELNSSLKRYKEQVDLNIKNETTFKTKLAKEVKENMELNVRIEEYKNMSKDNIKKLNDDKEFISDRKKLLDQTNSLHNEMKTRIEQAEALIEQERVKKLNELNIITNQCRELEIKCSRLENVEEELNKKEEAMQAIKKLLEDYKKDNDRLLKLTHKDYLLIEAELVKTILNKTSEDVFKKLSEVRQTNNLHKSYNELLNHSEGIVEELKAKNEENKVLVSSLVKYKKDIEELKTLLQDKSSSLTQNLDRVDQMMIQHMNKVKCPVPLRKVSQGEYIFGTRRIFAKLHNDNLVIRVGGGYLLIDEFLKVYTNYELGRLEREREVHDENKTRTLL